ncbi:hypothetical protein BBK82_04975 [Lentzea guizhouensis]|uniref:Phage tail tape measure protein n=1 Tax=Lentzea guizhouensis TaxID=1586287 RepID=A0A1B2HCU9_9PSEU|nr:hypothetical protein [Lentzea guizhouensis]ANZ35529.1 hypothetical protein BBK82_04975 [Lentzea guizhouensis]
MATLASLMVSLGLDPKKLRSGAAKARKYVDGVRADVERTNAVLSKMEAPIAALGKVGSLALLAKGAVVAKAAVAPLSGALFALPAAAGVAVGAMATVKMATAGVGEAMDALASGDAAAAQEALSKLSPAARSFVREMHATKQAFKPVQQMVQQRFFDRLGGDVSAVAKGHLPGLRAGLGETAGQLNGLAREALNASNTPFMHGVVADVLARTAKVIGLFKPAVGPAVTAIGAMAKAGMPLVESFGAWAAKGLQAKAAFLGTAEGATWLDQKVAAAQTTIGQLVAIAGNVRAVLSGLFGPANSGGTSLLAIVQNLTARMAAWVNSASGQERIAQVWDMITQAGHTIVEVLPLMIGPLGVLLGLLSSMDPQTQAVVASVLAWSVLLGPLAGKVIALVSALVQIYRAVPAVWAMAKAMWSGITTAASWVATHTAAAARTVAAWIAASARTVASLAVMAAQFVAQGAVIAASMAAHVARVVAGWVLMGVQALANAARMAAAWLIAMGPVGWVIAAVIGLVALIIAYWDEIAAATAAAWEWVSNAVSSAVDWVVNWVKSNWKLLITIILGPLGAIIALVVAHWDRIKSAFQSGVDTAISIFQWLGRLPGMVGGWFRGIYDAAVGKALELVSWLNGLPGRILGAIGDLGSLLLGAGRSVIDGLLRGISAGFQKVKDKLNELTNLLPDWKGPAVVDARILTPSGELIMQSLVDGFSRGQAQVERYLEGFTAGIGEVSIPTPRVPGLSMAVSGAAPAAEQRRERALVHIDNYHPPADASPHEVAEDLDWFSRGGG